MAVSGREHVGGQAAVAIMASAACFVGMISCSEMAIDEGEYR